MQNAIPIVKVFIKSAKKKEIIVDIPNIEITQVCNTTTMLQKYNWHLNFINNEAALDLELQSVKNY